MHVVRPVQAYEDDNMYIDFYVLPAAGIGLLTILLAKRIATPPFSRKQKNESEPIREPNNIIMWGARCFGVLFIAVILGTATSERTWYGNMMAKDSTRLRLLEKGKLASAESSGLFYQKGAPAGWAITYKFSAKDPKIGEEKTWSGITQGPSRFLMSSDGITVIYDPCEPRLNMEIRCFLNKPGYIDSFKKAGKLHLRDKFKDKFELEDMTSREWYDEQQIRQQ